MMMLMLMLMMILIGLLLKIKLIAGDDADVADTDDDADDGANNDPDADLLGSLTLDLRAAPSHCSTLTSALRGKQPDADVQMQMW